MKNMRKPVADLTSIIIEDNRWDSIELERICVISIGAVLKELKLPVDTYEISVLACDDARIAVLNADFRAKEVPTNVLSWPAFELGADADGGVPNLPPTLSGPFGLELGDIAISYDTCVREAAEASVKIDNHVCHLITHSCLHLLGFDHETDADAARMEGLETKILESLGIADPY